MNITNDIVVLGLASQAIWLGCVAIILITVLVIWIQKAAAATTLKRHRSKSAGLSDLLIYASLIKEDVILGKDGSFIASWLFRGRDSHGATAAELEQVSFRINEAVRSLGNGWVIHIDAVREEAPGYPAATESRFPDPLTSAIDDERRQYFEQRGTVYDGYFVITLTWLPPLLAERRFIELLYDDEGQEKKSSRERAQDLLDRFERDILSLENLLSIAFQITRLRGFTKQTEEGEQAIYNDLLAWVQRCITGSYQPIQVPPNPVFLDHLIGGAEFWPGVMPKIGTQFLQVIGLEGLPSRCYPGILNTLAEQSCEYRWSTRFIFLDRYQALAELRKYRKKWKQKIRGLFDQMFNLGGPQNQDAVDMTASAEAAMAELSSGEVGAGYYTSVIVLYSEDRARLEQDTQQVIKTIQRLGFVPRLETVNAVDAFLGSLPGHAVENVRRPLLNTLNLADLIPVNTIWTGSRTAPCPYYRENTPPLMQCVTSGRSPFRLNLHVGDLGHTLILGPTRSGKSTLLGLILAQLRRYARMEIFSFEIGESQYPLTAALRTTSDAQHHRLGGGDTQVGFAPFSHLETSSDRAWAAEWANILLGVAGLATTPVQRNKIGLALESMADTKSHTLSDFATGCQDEAIRQTLREFTIDGPMGHLLDSEKDSLHLSSFVTFELEDLMELGERFALPTLLYLFHRIESRLDGRPAAIIIDEGWFVLDHELFRARLRKWLKTLAKKNCIVIFATQSLSDVSQSGIMDVIAESTATKIYLPNVNARDDDASALYRRLGLNARQIDILAEAVPQRQYYIVSSSGRRLFELALGDLALAFVGATDKESISTIKSLEKQHGAHWIDTWLDMRRVRSSNLHKEAA